MAVRWNRAWTHYPGDVHSQPSDILDTPLSAPIVRYLQTSPSGLSEPFDPSEIKWRVTPAMAVSLADDGHFAFRGSGTDGERTMQIRTR
jgi:hypothetical protein